MFRPDKAGLESILGTIPEFVIVVDLGGRIRYINRAESGYDTEDLIGQRASDMVPASSDDRFDAALEALLETGEIQEYDALVSLPDGFTAWYRTRMLPLGDGATPHSVLLIATNVTELKAMQEKIAKLHRLLPICSWCGKIRDDQGQWQPVEKYLAKKEGKQVSHALCPDCYDREFGELDDLEESSGSVA